ncbi:protein-glutamate O-methyltransferase CheR [Salipiger bermudensis]|uniref:CheR family methyltransferase n=1 Tax=Salipiger bermudensis TaxID=344736 RepID=UPI001C9A2947|nr:protein-glutamate O-methyltransferase CheR [Salipiger bermudensis]MBY6002453.1 protein-glutamate O-methyltransferase CheR [Salipiger bermudensis]
MISAATVGGSGDFRFTDEDFKALAQLAHAEFGLALAESKKPLVYSRIARRLRARKIDDFSSYMALLKTTGEAEERLELISALTTNVTSFFREKHHFETLRKELIPQLARQPRIRIWSAGCSSGQEPFSIAMTLISSLPEPALRNARILATDIDPAMIRRANEARYPNEDLTTIPIDLQKSGTRPSSDEHACFELSDPVRRLVTFGELNLIEAWPFQGPFDAIFCRNVAIYFDHETQRRLWARFTSLLRDGGFLFIGHSERVSGPALDDLQTAGVTTYRKTAARKPAVAP